MAKNRPAPIIHTERLLALVPYISAHQGIAIADLANAFDVTTSQMSADLTTLWMCGLPGYTALELMDLSFEVVSAIFESIFQLSYRLCLG